ncbi:hypothetical protein GCM10023162_24860 [Klenkia terrae]
MSATLVARGLAAGHGAKVLFADLDLVVAPGDVVGLVGVNGAGKSTLLRTLAGLLPAEDGGISLSPPSATVGYLPQEHERRDGETVLGALARRTGVAPAQQEMDDALEALTAGTPDDGYADALERWLALGGADLEERAGEVLGTVAPGVAQDALMTGLSGGQAARVGLAALLLSRYDVLLLDEPTNDLDLAGLDQLESFVQGLRTGVVVVSHDREFLSRTVTRVVELDLAQQLVRVHDGGYEAYLTEREVDRRHAREEYEEFADTKSGLEARARMQKNWMAKGVRDSIKKSRSRRRRPSRPSGGSSGWRWWRSPARSGSCGWRSPPRRGRARWSPCCGVPSSGGAGSSWVRWTCRSTGATGWRSPGATGRGSPRCWGRCWAGSSSTRARRRWVRGCGWARWTRPGAASWVTCRCRRPSVPRCPTCPTPRCGRCWRSSGCGPTTCCGRRGR